MRRFEKLCDKFSAVRLSDRRFAQSSRRNRRKCHAQFRDIAWPGNGITDRTKADFERFSLQKVFFENARFLMASVTEYSAGDHDRAHGRNLRYYIVRLDGPIAERVPHPIGRFTEQYVCSFFCLQTHHEGARSFCF